MRKLTGYGPSLIVLGTAAMVLFIGPKAVQQLTYEQTRTRVRQAAFNLENSDILQKLNDAYTDVATLVEPSVVHVSAQYVERFAFPPQRNGLSTGSGWVFDDDGHVVTNHHVVQNAQRIQVQLYNGEMREARIVGSDPSTDIAVLKIDAGRIHPATLADVNAQVKQGDLVFAFGSPFDFRFSMSQGVVSGKDRSVGVIRDDFGRRLGYENFIQVDAAINPGNSGGPLTDYRGRVIGMNTAIATGRRSGGGAVTEEGQFAGIGLAIPIDMILPVVTQLIQTGRVEKGFMGVEPTELETADARAMGFIGQGVYIKSVEPDGPANRAGIKASDIITHVRGKSIASVAQLRSLISSALPGETVKLSLWRYDSDDGGKALDVEVSLGRLDAFRAGGSIPLDQSRESILGLGIVRMVTNSPELAEEYRADEFRPGVLILALEPGSSLARQIGPGSVIVDVMDQPVTNVDELIEALNRFDPRIPGGIRATVFTPKGQRQVISLRVR